MLLNIYSIIIDEYNTDVNTNTYKIFWKKFTNSKNIFVTTDYSDNF